MMDASERIQRISTAVTELIKSKCKEEGLAFPITCAIIGQSLTAGVVGFLLSPEGALWAAAHHAEPEEAAE